MSDLPHLAIIGTGNVGAALGARLAGVGYPIHFGVRPGSELAELRATIESAGGTASFESPAEAAAAASLIFLAVPAGAAIDAAASLGALGGKIVVDCTNPLRWEAGPVWSPPPAGSITKALAEALPGVTVLKAFNGFGAEFHADPRTTGGPADVLVAGDDAAAKQQLIEIANRAGFAGIDAGPLRNAALLENLAILWIHLATVGGHGREIAFKLLGRPH